MDGVKYMFKYYLTKIVRTILKLLYIFPEKKNRVLFYSFSGKDFSDSPKYISEYIEENNNKRYELVWAINNPRNFQYLVNRGYKVIKYNSLSHLYYGITSKFIITNTGPYKALEYRRSQIVINTWHGGGAYKKTGRDNPYKDKYKRLYNENFGQSGVKLFLSSSKAFTKYVIKGAYGYEGEIAEIGLPRNDILFKVNEHIRIESEVKRQLNIKNNEKILLFAPTWRNYETNNYEEIEVDKLLKACKERFGGDWVFVFRGHNLSNGVPYISKESHCINATSYYDMQRLLIASEALVSDYSSCIWDFSLMKKPCFLYTPDLQKYIQTFAFYTPIYCWGFSVCESNEELVASIKKFNMESYYACIDKNHNLFGDSETGTAIEYVYKYIVNENKSGEMV